MLPRFSGSRNTASNFNGWRFKQKPETPRSPLMSVAHSVRSKLSKATGAKPRQRHVVFDQGKPEYEQVWSFS
ncbi:unnamed protein product, partial [Mesorhabditis spiculigera]